MHFYPRPPRGGRRPYHHGILHHSGISIHVLREEDDATYNFGDITYNYISIHVLREEDDNAAVMLPRYLQISIHVLREEDDVVVFLSGRQAVFLSTSSARRTTKSCNKTCAAWEISIHVLREEDDCSCYLDYINRTDFYPRPPRGGRRRLEKRAEKPEKISIHVLREEDDSIRAHSLRTLCHFYPRPPRGGRLAL